MRRETRLSPAEQWRKTLAFWARGETFSTQSLTLDDCGGIGIVRRACRFTNVGDLLIADFGNGDDRWGWTGISSKGRRLRRFYQSMDRKRGGRVQRLKLPDEVAKLSPLDPVVRACLDSLRAVDVTALQLHPD